MPIIKKSLSVKLRNAIESSSTQWKLVTSPASFQIAAPRTA